jgi:hypothetical protein
MAQAAVASSMRGRGRAVGTDCCCQQHTRHRGVGAAVPLPARVSEWCICGWGGVGWGGRGNEWGDVLEQAVQAGWDWLPLWCRSSHIAAAVQKLHIISPETVVRPSLAVTALLLPPLARTPPPRLCGECTSTQQPSFEFWT